MTNVKKYTTLEKCLDAQDLATLVSMRKNFCRRVKYYDENMTLQAHQQMSSEIRDLAVLIENRQTVKTTDILTLLESDYE